MEPALREEMPKKGRAAGGKPLWPLGFTMFASFCSLLLPSTLEPVLSAAKHDDVIPSLPVKPWPAECSLPKSPLPPQTSLSVVFF